MQSGTLSTRGTVVNEGGHDGSGDAISMELMADHYCLNVQRPFDPEAHGLSPEFRLTKFGDLRNSRGMKPGRDETRTIFRVFDEDSQDEDRQNHEQIVTSWEETTVTRLDRMGLHLIETNDVLCPILDDPYLMGKIACANVLSGIYCLGVVDCASSRMILAISNRLEEAERDVVVPMMIRGYRDAARSVGTIVRGVRPISNPWCMIGGTASAVCSYHEIVPPDGATVGDVIVLTKPLGTMVAIMVNQWMQQSERRSRLLLTITEDDVKKAHCRAVDSMVRTNRLAAILMRKYNAHAACEVAVHGILGHSEILARRQKNPVSFVIHNIPIIAKMSGASKVTGNVMPLLQGLMPEVSGGLLVVLPREQAAAYCKVLERSERRQAWIVGIVESGDRTARVIDRPRVIEVPAKDTGSSLW